MYIIKLWTVSKRDSEPQTVDQPVDNDESALDHPVKLKTRK